MITWHRNFWDTVVVFALDHIYCYLVSHVLQLFLLEKLLSLSKFFTELYQLFLECFRFWWNVKLFQLFTNLGKSGLPYLRSCLSSPSYKSHGYGWILFLINRFSGTVVITTVPFSVYVFIHFYWGELTTYLHYIWSISNGYIL